MLFVRRPFLFALTLLAAASFALTVGCAAPANRYGPSTSANQVLPPVDFTSVQKPPLASEYPSAVRGQSPAAELPGGYSRYGMPASGAPMGAPYTGPPGYAAAPQVSSGIPFAPPPPAAMPSNQPGFAPPGYVPGNTSYPSGYAAPPPSVAPSAVAPAWPGMPGAAPNLPLPNDIPPQNYRDADIQVNVQETETGRFMFGVGVNSDLGLTGQIVIDERNFDWRAIPTSWDDVAAGRAFRGAGQGFRFEAAPGTEVQRYTMNFTEPYLLDSNVSLSLGAYYFTRGYFDYKEERVGGNVGFGYRLTPDLSAAVRLRAERINAYEPRVNTVAELNEIIGKNEIYSGKFTFSHDTRDQPFFATEGHFIEVGYEQVFGDFDFPKFTLDARKYFLLRERPDGSGRHTLALNTRFGIAGSQSPLFENFFAGGYSTMRGFEFRGASPRQGDVVIGGELQWLNTVEYIFPLTADDMLKGVVFCDFGTVERHLDFNTDNFRVAPGLGLRVSVPAMGPAPIALDFAFPIAKSDTDKTEVFSFFIGLGR